MLLTVFVLRANGIRDTPIAFIKFDSVTRLSPCSILHGRAFAICITNDKPEKIGILKIHLRANSSIWEKKSDFVTRATTKKFRVFIRLG